MGKNTRSKNKRGLGKPTGFEEYYADGPLTPAEHDEMCKLYSPSRPFIDRIEDALMRFQHKRRILPDRLSVFHKYLQYGGVSTGPNYGIGVSAKEVKGMTHEEAMKARTQTSVEKSRESQNLSISFNEVVKGFLGSFYITHFNPERQADVELATVTIKNFYTYLLFHDVCPEYREDIEEARKSCDLATKELSMSVKLVHNAPGAFNRSCSILFGGYHFASEWETLPGPDGLKIGDDHSSDVARKVMKYAIAAAGSYSQASRFKELADQDLLSTMKLEDIDGFEVIEVIQPTDDTRDFYEKVASDLIPVGRILARSYRDPANPEIDMSAEEREEWEKGNGPAYDLEFFLEPNLLQFCFPGLKIITGVWELNCGVYYFDEIMSTLPSFYTVIANDLMLNWRWPRDMTKEDSKQQDSIEESAKEAVEQYMKSAEAKTSGDATFAAEISEKVLKQCKEITGIENLTLADQPKVGAPGKVAMDGSDSEDD